MRPFLTQPLRPTDLGSSAGPAASISTRAAGQSALGKLREDRWTECADSSHATKRTMQNKYVQLVTSSVTKASLLLHGAPTTAPWHPRCPPGGAPHLPTCTLLLLPRPPHSSEEAPRTPELGEGLSHTPAGSCAGRSMTDRRDSGAGSQSFLTLANGLWSSPALSLRLCRKVNRHRNTQMQTLQATKKCVLSCCLLTIKT